MSSVEEVPRQLVIDAAPAPGDAGSGSGTSMAPFVLTAIAAAAVAKLVSPIAGLVVLGTAIVVGVLLRKPREGRFVLRIDGTTLEIGRERSTTTTRLELDAVTDITLDKQKHASGRGGAVAERVRIAFERKAPDDPIFVPEDPITPVEGQEWQGKVRVFLRKHGWLPEDERAGPVSGAS